MAPRYATQFIVFPPLLLVDQSLSIPPKFDSILKAAARNTQNHKRARHDCDFATHKPSIRHAISLSTPTARLDRIKPCPRTIMTKGTDGGRKC
ncbi:hypothetical protein IWX49DRAFT_359038 [Phyllosticta citricarpa]